MAVIYRKRSLFWTQPRSICVLARTAISAAGNWQLANPKIKTNPKRWGCGYEE